MVDGGEAGPLVNIVGERVALGPIPAPSSR
jgi:hypothetical protein